MKDTVQLTAIQTADLLRLTTTPQSTWGRNGAVFPSLNQLIDLGLAKTTMPISPHGYFQASLTPKGVQMKNQVESSETTR